MAQVINKLTIHGEDKLVVPLREIFKTSDPFNNLFAQPKDLPKDRPTTDEEYFRRMHLYGCPTLEEWRLNYWGFTNQPDDLVFTADKPTFFTVHFTTEGYSARRFIQRIGNHYQDLGFKLHFSCEKEGYEGAYYFRDGRTRRDRTWPYGTDTYQQGE